MSLKTYRDTEIQDFRKRNSADLQFGLQIAKTFMLLPIHSAIPLSGSGNALTIQANKLDRLGNVLSTISLPNDLIIYSSAKNQYIIDVTKVLSTYFTDGLYELEFANVYHIFKTAAFQVKEQKIRLSMDLTIVTMDSTLITFDQTHINI